MEKQERRVRCNHCMSIMYEEYLITDDTGEWCPVCGASDALMDMPATCEESGMHNL